MDPNDAYYDVFRPNRRKTIGRAEYYKGIMPVIEGLEGPFSRITYQEGSDFHEYQPTRGLNAIVHAFLRWYGNGMAFLHIYRRNDSSYRVYIPADLRHVADIVNVLWRKTPSLTGFKIAGYEDADNRSDVIVAWVAAMDGVQSIGHGIATSWLHGMRPPGSTMIARGCQIGYSDEVKGSSVGTEVTRDLRSGKLKS